MTNRAHGSLYDSEAALRLVDSTLQELTGVSSDAIEAEPAPVHAPEVPSRGDLVSRLEQGQDELVRTIQVLRQARGILGQQGAAGMEAADPSGGPRWDSAAAILSQVESRLASLCAVLDPSTGIPPSSRHAPGTLEPRAAGWGSKARPLVDDDVPASRSTRG